MSTAAVKTPWRTRVFEFSRQWRGAIYVLGAWMIFLSWVVGNTYKEKHSSLKKSIQEAKSTEFMTNRFDNLAADDFRTVKNQLNLIDPIPVDLPHERLQQWKELWVRIDRAETAYNAHASINSSAAAKLNLAKSLTWHAAIFDDTKRMTDELASEFESLRVKRHRCQEKMGDFRQHPTDHTLPKAKENVEEYRQVCNSSYRKYTGRHSSLSILSTELNKALDAELDDAKCWGAFWSYLASGLFVSGSLIVLYGQVFDKALPKPKEVTPQSHPPTVPA